MITKPTVFVLGAGASVPYGFPTGADLAHLVCVDIQNVGLPGQRFQDCAASRDLFAMFSADQLVQPDMMQRFVPAFRESGCVTLDEFVEVKGNHHFLPLVKGATIRRLIAAEREEWLDPDPRENGPATRPNVDWCRYLFRSMKTPDESGFSNNLVKVITFNFDRSFERKLFLMIRGSYGLSDERAAEVCRSVPVLHMHGMLGEPKWLKPTDNQARDYLSTSIDDHRMMSLASIKIIHEEIPQSVPDTAHQWLLEAQTICFLGFGYHTINIGRLRMNEPHPRATVWGTALGFSGPELATVGRRFVATGGLRLDADRDALSFLRSHAVLQVA